jgi:peptide/nickel transport system ATP-binding protein
MKRSRIILEGDVPSPIDPPPGCRFSSRCFKKLPLCEELQPDLREIKPNHYCACHLYD